MLIYNIQQHNELFCTAKRAKWRLLTSPQTVHASSYIKNKMEK